MRILVVDDNQSSASSMARLLSKHGVDVEAVFDGASAITRLERDPPDLVLTDLKMEPVGGMDVLRAARSLRPPVDVIVFTAYGAVGTAVEAMQLGAHDFLTKPVQFEQILARIEELRAPAQPTPELPANTSFVARSAPAQHLLRTLERVAKVPSPVWLEGEIGSGRGHAALTLHQLSGSDGPLVTFDVGREPAWPSAGTALLSNVDDLPDDLQRELARRLHHVPHGVRIIATASPDARQRVTEGRLRAELYYALSVIVVTVPPLRERVEDIAPLLEQGLARFAARYRREAPTIRASHRERLLEHAWPGNIRELLNAAERAVVLGGEALDLEVVRRSPPGLPNLEPGFSLSTYLEGVERRILVEALKLTNGDRNAAGRLLGVERNTLRYKLNKYDLLE